jgi:hypothetical protein
MRLPAGLMLGLLVGVLAVGGCGPAIPPEELGTVLEEVPEIPGADDGQAQNRRDRLAREAK